MRDADNFSSTFPIAARQLPQPAVGLLLWLSAHNRMAGQELNLSKLRKGKETQTLKSQIHFWGKELQSVTGGRAGPSLGVQFLLGPCHRFQLLSREPALLHGFFFGLLLREPALNPRLPEGSRPVLQTAINRAL